MQQAVEYHVRRIFRSFDSETSESDNGTIRDGYKLRQWSDDTESLAENSSEEEVDSAEMSPSASLGKIFDLSRSIDSSSCSSSEVEPIAFTYWCRCMFVWY